MDLDNFSKFNKGHSHAIGDKVIFESLAAAQRVLPDGGLLQRIGDQCDEFRVLLPNLAENEGRAVAKGIREAIEESSFSDVGQGLITTTIGLATYPETCGDLDDLFDEADGATGRAKTRENPCYNMLRFLDDQS